jgi:hypothetical protein
MLAGMIVDRTKVAYGAFFRLSPTDAAGTLAVGTALPEMKMGWSPSGRPAQFDLLALETR